MLAPRRHLGLAPPLNPPYVSIFFFAVSHWVAHLGPVHVVETERLRDVTSNAYRDALAGVLQFLGLRSSIAVWPTKAGSDRMLPRNEGREKGRLAQLDEPTRAALKRFYDPFNAALCGLLRGQAEGSGEAGGGLDACPVWSR